MALVLAVSAVTVAWAADGDGATSPADTASLPPPIFDLNDEARTGSRIPRRVVSGSKIPLNRRYADLTPGEQRIVRSQYEHLAPGDEPPFPRDGLAPIFRAFQTISEHRDVAGHLSFEVAVDASGSATGVSLTRGELDDATRQLATVLMLTPYKPGRCSGSPCAMSFPFRVDFRHDR